MLTLAPGPVFPARSTATPTAWSAPSLLTVVAAGHDTTPDRASTQLKLSETSLLFQPAAFGGGEATTVTTGGVLSMLTVALALPLLPARSSASPAISWSAPSLNIV